MRSFRMNFSYENPLRARLPQTFFDAIPRTPGVYFMRSLANEILYVGKAKCLRTRVLSYRNAKPGSVGENIIEMLERVVTIDWEELATESLAVERERLLIRAIVPPFNVADAWPEEYLFIGLRLLSEDRLEFRLTSREEDGIDFDLHGCFPHRGKTKSTYSALLRVLFTCMNQKPRFSFPAKLTRAAPAYSFALRIPNAATWKNRISSYLHRGDSTFVESLVEALLENETIPPFVRPGLQEDLELITEFGRLTPRRRPGLKTRVPLSKSALRRKILRSVR